MTHTMKLSEPWYTLVKTNKKTIEARILDDKRKLLKINDIIKFTDINGKKGFNKKIKKLKIFSSFEKALKYGKLKNILPGINTYKKGVELYYSIPNYKKKEKDNNVILIFF